MHGAGNSFVIIENMDGGLEKARLSQLAKELCTAYTSDGMIVTVPDEADGADFGMLFYNSDGSLGEMCGNGARCIARYGFEHGLAADPEEIRIRATAGIVTGTRITEDRYRVRLNDPSLAEPEKTVRVLGRDVVCSYILLGRPGIPHAVVICTREELEDREALRELGRALRYSPVFPKGVNVTFAVPAGENRVEAVTYERGVEDFTLACGTGCGSAAITLSMRGLLSENLLEIDMPGGHLSVTFERKNGTYSNILLTGPTAYID